MIIRQRLGACRFPRDFTRALQRRACSISGTAAWRNVRINFSVVPFQNCRRAGRGVPRLDDTPLAIRRRCHIFPILASAILTVFSGRTVLPDVSRTVRLDRCRLSDNVVRVCRRIVCCLRLSRRGEVTRRAVPCPALSRALRIGTGPIRLIARHIRARVRRCGCLCLRLRPFSFGESHHRRRRSPRDQNQDRDEAREPHAECVSE